MWDETVKSQPDDSDQFLNFLAEELMAGITQDIKNEKSTGYPNEKDPGRIREIKKSAIQVEQTRGVD